MKTTKLTNTISPRLLIIPILAFLVVPILALEEVEPIAYWTFDEQAGTVAYDYAADNHGAVFGAQWTQEGQINGALFFDGKKDYVMVGNTPSLEYQQFTLCFWAQLNDPEEKFQGGISKGWGHGSPTKYSYGIVFHNGNAIASITNTENEHISANASVQDTDWHMWTVTVADGLLALYRDGDLQDTEEYVGPIEYYSSLAGSPRNEKSNHNNFVIGARFKGFTTFDGTIDEVIFYDTALTADQIQHLYKTVIAGKASRPRPGDNSADIYPYNVTLSWQPDEQAESHDVYFGTDYDTVADADVDSPQYVGRQTPSSYNTEDLDVATTYYWRIDEVSGSYVAKGDVWNFTTEPPIIKVSDSELNFEVDFGNSASQQQTFSISNAGIGSLNWQIDESCNWLELDRSTGTSTDQPSEITLTVDTAGLAERTYQAEMTITSLPRAENNPLTVTVTLEPQCFPSSHPDYQIWVTLGKPTCWCNPRQCHGDADGQQQDSTNYWVSTPDLDILLAAWRKPYLDIQGLKHNGVDLICADFDRFAEGRKQFRVYTNDLNILLANWQTSDKPYPDCFDGY